MKPLTEDQQEPTKQKDESDWESNNNKCEKQKDGLMGLLQISDWGTKVVKNSLKIQKQVCPKICRMSD